MHILETGNQKQMLDVAGWLLKCSDKHFQAVLTSGYEEGSCPLYHKCFSSTGVLGPLLVLGPWQMFSLAIFVFPRLILCLVKEKKNENK